jgi:hypothetical protein
MRPNQELEIRARTGALGAQGFPGNTADYTRRKLSYLDNGLELVRVTIGYMATPERDTASAALHHDHILSCDLVAFRSASLTRFAAGFALGDLREFFAFFLAVPTNHRDHLGKMASML